MKPQISIIIVNYETAKFLVECLGSIRKTTDNFENPACEAIVVDNSGDFEDGQGLKLIKNKENVGFAKAVNQGIKSAQGDFVFLLNPDTKIKSGTIQALLNFAKKTADAGVIGAKLLSQDGNVQPSCYHRPTIVGAIKEYFLGQAGAFSKYAPSTVNPAKVDAVVGAAFLITPQARAKVGLFDERYFLYFEDLDYCRRVKNAGLSVYFLPKANIIHEHGVAGISIPEETRRWLRESSKLYHGTIKYWLLTFVLWLGQKWQRILR